MAEIKLASFAPVRRTSRVFRRYKCTVILSSFRAILCMKSRISSRADRIKRVLFTDLKKRIFFFKFISPCPGGFFRFSITFDRPT